MGERVVRIGRDNLSAIDLRQRADVAQTTRSPARNTDPELALCLTHRVIFILISLSVSSHRGTPKMGWRVHLMTLQGGERTRPCTLASWENDLSLS